MTIQTRYLSADTHVDVYRGMEEEEEEVFGKSSIYLHLMKQEARSEKRRCQ